MDRPTSTAHKHVQPHDSRAAGVNDNNVNVANSVNNAFTSHDQHEANPYGAGFPNGHDRSFDLANWGHVPGPQAHGGSAEPSWLHGQPAHGQALAFNQNLGHYGAFHPHNHSSLQGALVGSFGVQNNQFSTYGSAFAPQSASMNQTLSMPLNAGPAAQAATIAPRVLENGSAAVMNGGEPGSRPQFTPSNALSLTNVPSAQSQNSSAATPEALSATLPEFFIPPGQTQGDFSIVNYDALVQATQSERVNSFVNIGLEPISVNSTKTTIPKYKKRKSRNEIGHLKAQGQQQPAKSSKKRKNSGEVNPNNSEGSQERRTPAPPRRRTTTARPQSGQPSDEPDDSSNSPATESADEEPEVVEPPLPKMRPQSPLEAIRHDAVLAVWSRPDRSLQAEDIRIGVQKYTNIVRDIHDDWKTDQDGLKSAQGRNDEAKVRQLTERLKHHRERMTVVMEAGYQLGHNDIISRLSENPRFLFHVRSFLADRATENDYADKIWLEALELLGDCTTLTSAKVEQAHLEKIFTRVEKKGTPEMITLVKRIKENVAGADEKLAEQPNTKTSADSKEQDEERKSASRSASESVVGTKRAAPIDGSNGQAPKRLQSNTAPSASAAKTSKVVINTKKQPVASSPGKSQSTAYAAAPTKVKAQQVVAKPTNFFTALQSASKKPGTSNAALAAAKLKSPSTSAAPAKKPMLTSNPRPTKPAPSNTYSFSAMLADITKPKEPVVPVKVAEKLPPETDEERAKRLRKEERRKLRVTWKHDDQLVSVRYFQHDPEEETRDDANMTRDAGDVGLEARMFRRHRVDPNDDDDEISSKPWTVPSLVIYDDMDPEQRPLNYTKTCGPHTPSRVETDVQVAREAGSLMVYYSTRADIPSTPREVSNLITGGSGPLVDFGAAPDAVLRREAARKGSGPVGSAQTMQDVTGILSRLHQPQQQHPVPLAQAQAPVPPPAENQFAELEAVFAKAAAEHQERRVQELAASLTEQQVATMVAALASVSSQPQPLPPPPVQSSPAPDLQSVLAALQGRQQPVQGFNYGQGGQPGTAQGPFVGAGGGSGGQVGPRTHYEDPERKRLREGSYGDRAPYDPSKRQRTARHHPNMYSLPCRFYREGKCIKGAQCTYRHD